MKNFILVSALALITSTSFAATDFAVFFNDNRGIEQARLLANKLQLNESTFIKLKQIKDSKFKELDEALSQEITVTDRAKIKAAIERRYNLQIENLLTPAQKVLFASLTQYKAPVILAIE